MTGRRLYEIVTDEIRRSGAHLKHYNDSALALNSFALDETKDPPIVPPAFAFLKRQEQGAWNAAARRLSGRRK